VACPGETLGSPWPPPPIRPWTEEGVGGGGGVREEKAKEEGRLRFEQRRIKMETIFELSRDTERDIERESRDTGSPGWVG
jgi:hypothetical protein